MWRDLRTWSLVCAAVLTACSSGTHGEDDAGGGGTRDAGPPGLPDAAGVEPDGGPVTADGAAQDGGDPDASQLPPWASFNPDVPPPPSPEDPTCAADTDASCYYVAPDGDDEAPGTVEQPFRTFRAALVLAGPGDVIYARGGTYGPDHAMPYRVSKIHDSEGATSCPDGQVLSGDYCYVDRTALIAINSFSGWASDSPPHDVRSGTDEAPITIRAFPGERPVLAPEGRKAVHVSLKAHWVVQGLEIRGTGDQAVEITGGTSDAQTHDIYVLDNEIHDVGGHTRANNGIIRVNRGDTGGPYNVFIYRNQLHHLWDRDQPSTWRDTTDLQHFGAVTTLSRENYFGYDGGGTGYIEIVANEIHDVPMAFFFKNPMRGPVEIRHNVIHDAKRLGDLSAANVRMVDNLVFDVPNGWYKGPWHDYPDDPETYTIAGHDALIEHNTFVGLNNLFDVRAGTGHTIRRNVFLRPGGGSLIRKSATYSDPLDPAESLLQEIASDDNCILNPSADYTHVSRKLPSEVTGGDPVEELYDLAEAGEVFGFDRASRFHVVEDAGAVFVSPEDGDYRLRDDSMCPDMGRRR